MLAAAEDLLDLAELELFRELHFGRSVVQLQARAEDLAALVLHDHRALAAAHLHDLRGVLELHQMRRRLALDQVYAGAATDAHLALVVLAPSEHLAALYPILAAN